MASGITRLLERRCRPAIPRTGSRPQAGILVLSPSEQRFDVELNCLSNVRLRFFHGVTLSEASGQGWNGCHVGAGS